ncbi:M-phase inducer phosphatase [Senna tora]|uniref:M-phase inducer phosphatase n=1 Tax=Senna tora TaxID=362788 RepID=A0A835CE38_9FABA|nr:M-phase inducer phosphatase [Senna tora]
MTSNLRLHLFLALYSFVGETSFDPKAGRKPSRTSAHVAKEGVRHKQGNNPSLTLELILKTSEIATIGALFNFSGNKPKYHEVQKNPPVLAPCPATKNCISTENNTDLSHYAPPCMGFQVKALELKLLGGLHLLLPKIAEVEAARMTVSPSSRKEIMMHY